MKTCSIHCKGCRRFAKYEKSVKLNIMKSGLTSFSASATQNKFGTLSVAKVTKVMELRSYCVKVTITKASTI